MGRGEGRGAQAGKLRVANDEIRRERVLTEAPESNSDLMLGSQVGEIGHRREGCILYDFDVLKKNLPIPELAN